MIIPHDVEEGFIGLQNPAVEIPDEGANDVGVDQAPNFRFAFPQCLFGLLALHVLDPQRFVRDLQSLIGVAQRLTSPPMITLFDPNSRYQEVDDE